MVSTAEIQSKFKKKKRVGGKELSHFGGVCLCPTGMRYSAFSNLQFLLALLHQSSDLQNGCAHENWGTYLFL